MKTMLSLPKADIHLHLEGSARHETIAEFARRENKDLSNLYAFSSLKTFMPCYELLLSVIKFPEDVERICLELVHDEADQGVSYIEPSINPFYYSNLFHISVEEAFELIRNAFKSASDEKGVEVGYLIGAVRNDGAEVANAYAEFAAEKSSEGVVAFGICGDEEAVGPEVFDRACSIAKEAGLLVVPHAGETPGPGGIDKIWKALEFLKPDRIAHGVRAADDPKLLDELVFRGITCDVCVTSNLMTNLYRDVHHHPIKILLDAGVRVSLNTDDQLFLRSSISQEYELVRKTFNLTDSDMASIARTSIDASGASRGTKKKVLKKITQWILE